MKLKNIIILCDFASITGGAEKVAITSAIALAEAGDNVVMFTGKGPICDELKNSGVKTICLNQEEAIKDTSRFRGIVRGIYNTSAKEEMEQLLDEFDPKDTVIHMHGWSKVFSSFIFVPIKKRGFKVLVTMHDYFLQCPNGCCYDFQKKEICTKKTMSLSCIKCNCDKRNYVHKLYRVIRQFFMKRLIDGTELYVAFISKFNQNVSEGYIPFKYKKTLILNPIDVELQVIVSVCENRKYIFIGRLSYEKGIDIFCEGTTKAEVPAVVVGVGERLEELKTKYPGIEFVGWKSKNEMKQYIMQTRALIFPSVWYEGAPLTIPEVMGGYCLPCIVSDCSAGRDYIEDGKNGLIYSGKDVNGLIRAIQKLEDNEFLVELQNNIRNGFNRDQYSSKQHIKNLKKCYEKMLTEE